MNFENIQEWLSQKLHIANDAEIGAGGTGLSDLQREAAARMVTPAALTTVPTEIGRVIRYVRESNGWTRSELADLATIDEADIAIIETSREVEIAPRSLMQLADTCGFSRRKFQELARHMVPNQLQFGALGPLPFAAQSENRGEISNEDFEAVRTLILVLSEKTDIDE